MSFVLEALKKQEASTDPEAAVSLARAGVLRRRHRRWMWIAGAAMAVNAALLLWVFGPLGQRAEAPPDAAGRADGPATIADAGTAARAPAPPTPADDTTPAERETARDPAAAAFVRSRTPDTEPSPRPAPASRAAGSAPAAAAPAATRPAESRPALPATIALADLPADARSRFPGIAFSTHIYAEDPTLRAVFANGKRHEEGGRIRGLEILEITETGVVLAFENYRVEVPVVVDWDSL